MGKPVVVITPDDLSAILRPHLALRHCESALRSAEEEGADWVARRELVERSAAAQQELHGLIEQTWNS